MQMIIYCKGKLFQQYKEMIDWSMVTAIADKKAGQDETIYNRPVIFPFQILDLKYDYIAVFSDRFFYEIRRELIGEYYIEPERIVSWRCLLKRENVLDTFFTVKKIIQALNVGSMLDTDICIFPEYIFSKNELSMNESFVLDGVGTQKFVSFRQIYGKIYNGIDNIKQEYDLIYVNHLWKIDTVFLKKIFKCSLSYVLLRVSYIGYTAEKVQNIDVVLKKYGTVQKFYLADSLYFLVCIDHVDDESVDAQIYVVTHRDYNVLNNELYRPICVGTQYHNSLYFSEHQGENISYLNEKINECTALYWIWKNTCSEYVGINHYRRYFYNNKIFSEDNYLNKNNIKHIFQRYDIILPEYKCFDNVSVSEQMRSTISTDAFEKGYQVVRSTLNEHQPDYVDAFDEVMQGHKLFMCNMFVTRRDIFNEYCEWLFSFLIEAAECIDVHEYDDYSKRVIGFFAERMLTVWLLKHNFKIKELPIDSWE